MTHNGSHSHLGAPDGTYLIYYDGSSSGSSDCGHYNPTICRYGHCRCSYRSILWGEPLCFVLYTFFFLVFVFSFSLHVSVCVFVCLFVCVRVCVCACVWGTGASTRRSARARERDSLSKGGYIIIILTSGVSYGLNDAGKRLASRLHRHRTALGHASTMQ